MLGPNTLSSFSRAGKAFWSEQVLPNAEDSSHPCKLSDITVAEDSIHPCKPTQSRKIQSTRVSYQISQGSKTQAVPLTSKNSRFRPKTPDLTVLVLLDFVILCRHCGVFQFCILVSGFISFVFWLVFTWSGVCSTLGA